MQSINLFASLFACPVIQLFAVGAWIITGGTNTGVMKHVGEALRDHSIKYGKKKQLVALGIATWGCIENRDHLIPDKSEVVPLSISLQILPYFRAKHVKSREFI